MNKFRNYKIKKIDNLKEYESNSRTHSKEQIQKVVDSINEFGFTNPLLIDENNTIIAGHCRLEAAKRLGMDEVPCIVLDGLSDEQKAALVIADNRIALDAGWNYDILKNRFSFLKGSDYDLLKTGFDIDEIADIFPADEPEVFCADDDCPDVPDEPIAKLGDVWLLGSHRLLCGDATSIDAVDKLMDGVKADMVFTDIPYSISQKSNGLRELDYGEWDKGVKNIGVDVLNTIISFNSGAFYIFCGDEQLSLLLIALRGYKMSTRTLAWVKPNPTVINGEKLWLPAIELCAYGKPVKGVHNAHCKRGIYEGGTITKDRVHPNQKPVELVQMCVDASSNTGDTVLDLFGGSGSTLIACEKLGRKCYMMELSEQYCDTIIKRYENYTGKKAILEV